jgi:hypothetical protein
MLRHAPPWCGDEIGTDVLKNQREKSDHENFLFLVFT